MVSTIAIIFFGAALIGVPIAFSAGLAGALYMIIWDGLAPDVVIRTIYYKIDHFALLAIPIFIAMGTVAERSGMLDDLTRWLSILVGRMKAGVAYINVIGSMVFAGVSGAAVADVASLGPIERKMMKEAGYVDDFSACLTAASAVVGPILPPSIAMVVYALAAGNVSIGGLFLAGAIPGVLIGVALLVLSFVMTRNQPQLKPRDPLPKGRLIPEIVASTRRASLFLVLPGILVGGIVGGITTVTEASAVGLAYTIAVGFFITRRLSLRDVYEAMVSAAIMSAIVGMLIAGGALIGYILTRNQATAQLAELLMSISTDPVFFMVAVVSALILAGMFMDAMVVIIALAPLLAPIAAIYGISTLQFGVTFIVAIEIGLITPPVGILLFMVSTIHQVKLETLYVRILPFVAAELVVAYLLAFVPALTLWFPGLFGFR